MVGGKLQPGAAAPDFALDSFDGAAMHTVRRADSSGQVRLLDVVNSLDTPVCHMETRRWEGLRAALPKEWRLLQRAVFVIDGTGGITYAEYVPDQMCEPDYDAAVAAVHRVAA